MLDPWEAILSAGGLFGKVNDADQPVDVKLTGQVATWSLIRKHFWQYRPKLVLLNVDPWPNRPPMQPWLDAHFAGLHRRVRNRVELDVRALDSEVAMDLFTNVMRFMPTTVSGRAAETLPQIYNLILKLEDVSAGVLVEFLAEFVAGNAWGKPYGSLSSEFRASAKRFVEGARGRVVVHPTMGIQNIVSVYASPESLTSVKGALVEQFHLWSRARGVEGHELN